jgi:hypothetical protein
VLFHRKWILVFTEWINAPVHDRRASNHSPGTASRVEDGEFERSTGASVEFLDISLLHCRVTGDGQTTKGTAHEKRIF